MSVLLDSNLLTRSVEVGHPHHQPALDAIATLRARAEDLVLVPQNLYEFYAVATRPVKDRGLEMTPARAAAMIEHFEGIYTLRADTTAVYDSWKSLIAAHGVSGKAAHDARLAAAMQAHGIVGLLTFNGGDFRRYPHVQVIDPITLHSPGSAPS